MKIIILIMTFGFLGGLKAKEANYVSICFEDTNSGVKIASEVKRSLFYSNIPFKTNNKYSQEKWSEKFKNYLTQKNTIEYDIVSQGRKLVDSFDLEYDDKEIASLSEYKYLASFIRERIGLVADTDPHLKLLEQFFSDHVGFDSFELIDIPIFVPHLNLNTQIGIQDRCARVPVSYARRANHIVSHKPIFVEVNRHLYGVLDNKNRATFILHHLLQEAYFYQDLPRKNQFFAHVIKYILSTNFKTDNDRSVLKSIVGSYIKE